MEDIQKRGYLQENFRLFHLRSDQIPRVDYHYHEFCKLLFLLSGSGCYVVDSQRYLLQPGDVVLIGSRSVHRPELESGTPYERIILYISPEFLQGESAPDCDLLACFRGEQGHVLRLKEANRRRLFAMATALERELSTEQYGRMVLSKAALLRLLAEVGQNLHFSDAQYPSPVLPKSDRVQKMQSFIEEHLADDLDIDALAERFFVSKYHLMRQFRRETGSSIHAYLSLRRLLHARALIDGGMRATEACYRSGFRSYSSFTRAYGKHFGTTPTGRVDAASRQMEVPE